ncbi:MAG: right-handed parallel beta-helix repeat-containing protein, partial [Promethearchaeota archaeon]
MINRKNQKLMTIFTSIVICSFMSMMISTNLNVSNGKFELSNNYDTGLLKMATLYQDLIIDDNGAQDWEWAKISGICTGMGTVVNPYRILNGVFEYQSYPDGHCLQILNSRKYFILRNCTFRDADMLGAGLYMNNVTNGLIDDCFVVSDLYLDCTGIYMENVNNTQIRNTYIHDNGNDGIYMLDSHFNTIRYNNISANEDRGIYLTQSTFNTISNNEINDNQNADGILMDTNSD